MDLTNCMVNEMGEDRNSYLPPVTGMPGKRSVMNFIRTALMPVGTTLYLFGGGWDREDTGAGPQARSIGIAPEWIRFFLAHDASFTFKDRDGDETKRDEANSYYPFSGINEYCHAGLDCSGYVGWTIYNTFETENGKDGYVLSSTIMARMLYDRGWGTFRNRYEPDCIPLKPGDVVSMKGHVWISLGTCPDGSIVILHSTPSMSRSGQPGGGVQISAVGSEEDCQAYAIARHYMKTWYPRWDDRYEAVLRPPGTYLIFEDEAAGIFSWDPEGKNGGLQDPDGIRSCTPDEVLRRVFRGVKI